MAAKYMNMTSGFSLALAIGLVFACGGAPKGAAVPTAGTAPSADPSLPTTDTHVPEGAGTGQKLVPAASASATGSAGPSGPEPGRGPSDIGDAVKAKRAEARACFDAVAAGKPGLQGNIVVRWVIDPKGAVKDIMIDPDKTTIPDQTIGACIMKVISKLTFPPSAKHFETKASYPFNFVAAVPPG